MGRSNASTLLPESPSTQPVEPFALAPFLLWVVGWSAGILIGDLTEGLRVRRALQGLSGPDWDVRHALDGHGAPAAYPRWLRQARGVGRRRSVDLARYLWFEGPDAPPEGLPGIGQKTGASVRSALAELARAGAGR
ncbi:MAG: hypothetical protein AAGG01_00130 [Planctomycetota bacterium]